MASDFLMEEREDLMLSTTAESRRTAHFLNPTVASLDGPVAAPSLDPPASKPKDLPLKVKFSAWRRPQDKWKSWVEQMRSLHSSAWETAGILDAIINSTYTIHRNDDLIFGFVDRWCPATNTFVLPWGEATITLEDVKVIGGYSVLGASVLTHPDDAESKAIERKLLTARSEISKTKSKKANQGLWLAKFMGNQKEIEHEAFLAYWLSRFVFPFHLDVIGREVLPIAVALARGTRIALAPAVLACIYKSLNTLKTAASAVRKSGQNLEVTVSAPLQLVQAWIWERFPTLRPNPNSIELNNPRLARWDQLKKLGIGNLSHTIDSASKDFIWRPYMMDLGSNAIPRMIYMDSEYWALIEPELDDELEGLIRCLRSSELVGLEADCVEQKLPYRVTSIEQYLPHRVARQFGLDQDIPGHVARVNVNAQVAWSDYTRPIRDMKIYIPPRLSKPECTTRYLKWWEKLRQAWCGATKAGTNVNCTYNSPKVEKLDLVGVKLEDKELPPPPGFSPKRRSSVEAGDSGTSKQFQERQATTTLASPPADTGTCGQSSIPRRLKRKYVETSLRKITDYYVSPMRKGSKSGFERKEIRAKLFSDNDATQDGNQGKDDLSSTADNVIIEENAVELPESGARGSDMKEASQGCTDESNMKNSGGHPSPVQSSTSEAFGMVVKLEERIKKLEEQCCWLKGGKLLCQ